MESSTIDRRKYFRETMIEGYGTSFHVMQRWVYSQSRSFMGGFPSFGEERDMAYIEQYGHPDEFAKGDIIPIHNIDRERLESVRNCNIDLPMPLGVKLTNGKVCIYDGHHRIVNAIERGENRIRMKVVDAPSYVSDEIITLINNNR